MDRAVEEGFDLALNEGGEPARHLVVWADPSSGLRAICVIDNATLGPAAGGIRTQPYPSVRHAVADAARLARAMTEKCALAGLAAGGGKIVVVESPGMNREAAFAALGQRIEDLRGAFVAGPDLGTTSADLRQAAEHTRYLEANIAKTSKAVARGVLACVEACVRVKGDKPLAELSLAVQGCGAVGASVARTLARTGAKLKVADVDAERARVLSEETGAEVIGPGEVMTAPVDILVPCATGGVITAARAASMQAWAVCGGANNILDGEGTAAALLAKGILLVPDVISSAGGVIEGVGGEAGPDRVAGLATVAEEILRASLQTGQTTVALAQARARARLDEGAPR